MDEKEYQPGVWYDMDIEAPTSARYFVLHYIWRSGHTEIDDYCFGYGDGNGGVKCTFEGINPIHWMLIPEPPKK